MNFVRTFSLLSVIGILGVSSMKAQDSEVGIPIDNQLTIAKCGGCHLRDANWHDATVVLHSDQSGGLVEQAIKRMVRLNGVTLKPEEAHEILRYLSANNGLAPEEGQAGFLGG